MVGRRLAVVVLVAVSLFVTSTAFGATEAELSEVRDEIDRLTARIESAEAAKTDAAREVIAAQERLSDLVGQVEEAQAVLAGIEADIAAGEQELAEVNALLEHLESALATTRLRMGETKDALSAQVVELYMNASTAGARLFGFDGATEATIGFAYVDGAMGDSSRMLDQLDILADEVDRQQQILDEQRARQEELLGELAVQRERQEEEVVRVDSLRAQAADAVAAAQALVDEFNADIAAYEEHKQGLEADAAALEAELAARPATGQQPSDGLGRPVAGPVTSPYGYRVHPIFGTKKLHTGWDLSAGSGQPIVASASGTVVSAGPRGGYGNAVVIDHGGGLATLYAHQSSVAVSSGQSVERGQVIGYIGCTGYCTGPHLHFEVRVGGRPVDPSGYVG